MGDVIDGHLHSESIFYFFESAKTHTNFSSRTTQQLSQYTQKTQLLIFLAVFLLLINLTQAEMIKMKRHTSSSSSPALPLQQTHNNHFLHTYSVGTVYV